MERDLITGDFFLRLPAPRAHICLTRPHFEDAKHIPLILNDDRVYPWMGAGLPYPHQQEHALNWIKSVKPRCDSGQEDLKKIQGKNLFSFPVSECPVRIIREFKPGCEPVYLGDCGIKRWSFLEVTDEQEQRLLRQDNESKAVGDPTIIWTIGYYLAPSHSGQGVMGAAVGALINWAMTNMGLRHMRTMTMVGNQSSLKVLEKNGFTVEKTLEGLALKQGENVGLHVLDWRAPS